MIKNPSHLTVNEIAAIGPIAFSVRFENADYKNYWCVDFIGEAGQVFLSDEFGRPIKFENKEAATQFCEKHWPDLALGFRIP